MKLGFVILAHENLHRVEQLVRHLADQQCVVSIHIDKNTKNGDFQGLVNGLSDVPEVVFSRRTACEWGRFSIVKATLDASEKLFDTFPDTSHVCLISGSCLPVRPIRQFHKFLLRNKQTDFIESVSVQNNYWVKGGLNEERFSLYFPFSWRKHRWLFDRSVALQRKLKIKRKTPDRLVPHIGSQWWCLTKRTLKKILNDPHRPHYDNYFKSSWIPDESYFQTLARLHSKKLESRSLTFSKFDFLGKPYTFYNDQLDLMMSSDCFMARKIWSGADDLYAILLDSKRANQPMTKANPKRLIDTFDAADQTRCEGGEGRFHPGRFPLGQAQGSGVSAGEYTVFAGFKDLYEHFPEWLGQNTDALPHGRIFAPRHVANKKSGQHFEGNLPAVAGIRNRNVRSYLSNFLWANREQHQCFIYELNDTKEVPGILSHDRNAKIIMVRHSWLLLLLNRKSSFREILIAAQNFQKIEQNFLEEMAEANKSSRLMIMELDDAVQKTSEMLLQATEHLVPPNRRRLQVMPKMHNLDKLDSLVRKLRNKGLKIRYEHKQKEKPNAASEPAGYSKPYVVK